MHPLKRLDGSFKNSPANGFLLDTIKWGIIILEQRMVVWDTCRHIILDLSSLNWMWLIQQQGGFHFWHRRILPNDVLNIWFPSPKNLGCVEIDCIIPFRYSHRRQQLWNIRRSLFGLSLRALRFTLNLSITVQRMFATVSSRPTEL